MTNKTTEIKEEISLRDIREKEVIKMTNKTTEIKEAISLRDIREKFGTLIVEEIKVGMQSDNYRGCGRRIVICTTSEGIKGNGGKAYVDFALTFEMAEALIKNLRKDLRLYQKNKEREWEKLNPGANKNKT